MSTNNLENWWMPFTDNKAFKANPRLLKGAKGMYYTKNDGTDIIDSTAGLWCCNVGHGNAKITEAISNQLQEMDYCPGFHMGNDKTFQLSTRITDMAPDGFNHVFFTNSGSESVDTALKIAANYWRAQGQGHRRLFVGRERGYHGVGFGGISVGGMTPNRKTFGNMLPVDHLPHTHLIDKNAFSRGQPEHGEYLADVLEGIVTLHDASNIAAVIIEPMAGSTGGLVAPKGYLQKIRDICTKHGILLIFDEVITGFGRLGHNFASQKYGVVPDIFTTAKALTNGVIPMGAVFVNDNIYHGSVDHVDGIQLFHGYTYSGHPVAVAAANATLDIMADEGAIENARTLTPYYEDMIHSLKDCPNVIDIRNEGLVGVVEFEPMVDKSGAVKPGARAFDVFNKGFHRHGIMCRASGDTIATSPPLILNKSHIDEIGDKLRAAICDDNPL